MTFVLIINGKFVIEHTEKCIYNKEKVIEREEFVRCNKMKCKSKVKTCLESLWM